MPFKIYENVLNHIGLCSKFIHGTDFNWKKLLSKSLKNVNKDFDADENWGIRKTHINEAIRRLPGSDKRHINNYSCLCDLVHPNIGSYWMVMDIRENFEGDFYNTTLSDKPVNGDAIVIFLIAASSALAPLITLTEQQIKGANNIAKRVQGWAIASMN